MTTHSDTGWKTTPIVEDRRKVPRNDLLPTHCGRVACNRGCTMSVDSRSGVVRRQRQRQAAATQSESVDMRWGRTRSDVRGRGEEADASQAGEFC